MHKLIAIALLCTPFVLTSAPAAADVFTDIDRAAPRGALALPSDAIARGLFDDINSSAPVRRPGPRDDIYPGE